MNLSGGLGLGKRRGPSGAYSDEGARVDGFGRFLAGVVCGIGVAWLGLVAVEDAVARGCHFPERGQR